MDVSIKASLLVTQHETDIPRKIIARLLCVSMLLERLQRSPVDLESVLKQPEWYDSPRSITHRQAALEQRRKQFEKGTQKICRCKGRNRLRMTQRFCGNPTVILNQDHTAQQDITACEECCVFHSTIA